MTARTYNWGAGDADHEVRLVRVPGTEGTPYLFGAEPNRRPIEVRDFYMTSTPVTQALWTHVSHDIDRVAWYGPRFSWPRRLVCRLLGWRRGWRLVGRFRRRTPTRTHDVATKAPNQLGLYDLCGNVWEWCQDACVDEIDAVPRDGTPWLGPSPDRRLRGGCHHNWDIPCTVSFRYGIAQDAHDGCIGFRLVLAPV